MAKEGRNNNKGGFKGKVQPEFEQVIVDLARVTRVMAGGKRMRFRACVALGDRRGRVGWGVAKGADVAIAVNKAVSKGKKNMIKVRLINETIPHKIEAKFKSAKVMLKPAVKGTGIIAGGSVRNILELAGVPNIYGKILGRSNNKINNIQATFLALAGLKYPAEAAVENKIEEIKEELKPEDLIKDEELEEEQKKLLKKAGLEDALTVGLATLKPARKGFKI
ncbi:MAG: 30S ribosomal protein S5 [Candidatus Komeilibacteria bacterium]|nr:30S ribosomal protein S5 [Candidatus Komeilibacteria bacterium]